MSDADENKSPEPGDLENLLNGFDMTPEWAKSDPGVQAEPPRKQHDRDRRGPGPRGPRGKSSRRDMSGVRVKPKRDPLPRGEGGGAHGGAHGGHRGGQQGGGRWSNERPARPPRLPVHVDFIPEKNRLSKVVKIIRASHRAFPLDEIAGRFMENEQFLAVKLTVREKAPDAEEFEFFQCRANGLVFTERAACEAYIVDHGLPEYFEVETREVDPPAGNFLVVGRDRKSGVLIGPPNWHGYQKRLEEVRAERAPNMSLEQFGSVIEKVSDEDAIEAWKKELSTQSFYRLKPEEKPAEKAPESDDEPAKDADAEAAATEVAPVVEETAPAGEGAPEDAAPESGSEESSADTETEAPAEEPGEDAAAEENVPAEEAVAEAEAPAPEETVDDRPFDLSREEAERLFRTKHLGQLMSVSRRAIMPGYQIVKLSDPGLKSALNFHLNRERNNPSSIIFALRPAFKHMRLYLFRHGGRMHVSGVQPHPLPEGQTLAEDLSRILAYVAEHEGCPSKDVLVALGPEQGEGVEPTPELVSHLHWLIEKGHVIEFSDGTLSMPHSRK